ncbi:signal peptide peptidase SppA [Candidatus Sumerlaeota bacterium]|nr:signal peptide peptidase SppA [Candidatus Sumerlaeota bacterium]
MLKFKATLFVVFVSVCGFAAAAPTPVAKPKAVIPVLEVGGDIVERKGPLGFLDTEKSTLRDMTESVRQAARDSEVVALIVHFDQPGWGSAQAMDFHDALKDFRKSEKPLYVYADSMSFGTYTVATAASEIIQPPVGGLDVYGLNLSLYFMKDLLGKLGVEGDVVNTGPFKDAMEPFVSNEMGEGTRTQYTAILNDVFKTASETVAANRGMPLEDAQKLLTGGPYTSKDALAKKAIDRVEYLDDFTDSLYGEYKDKDLELVYDYSAGSRKKPEAPSLMSLIMGAAKQSARSADAKPKIAVVYALGNIVEGRVDQSNPFSRENVIAALDFIDVLDEVAEDKGVKAIVLRVSSPGGSAIASDMIWKRLQDIRKDDIPIVVSMGDVAASGGYYISMGANKIVAEPTTITGSIGVIGGKFSLAGTYDKVGLHKQSLSIGENVEIYSETKKWDERERGILSRLLDDVYNEFTSKAALGRGKTQDEIKAVAGGRVWSGMAAKEQGLVDELGSLDTAIAEARELANAPEAPVVEYPKELTFLEFLEKTLSGEKTATLGVHSSSGGTMTALQHNPLVQAAGAMLPPKQLQQALFIVDSLSAKPGVMLAMPQAFEIK